MILDKIFLSETVSMLSRKSLVLMSAIIFSFIICTAVSATDYTNSNIKISSSSSNSYINPLTSSSAYPKKIDSGVTNCYWFKGSKYYWTTYLYKDKIVIYSHFYNPNLKRDVYQKTIIAPYIHNGKRSGVYFYITPKSNGKSNYINISGGFNGTILQYYWTGIRSMGYWNFRTYMISYAPNH